MATKKKETKKKAAPRKKINIVKDAEPVNEVLDVNVEVMNGDPSVFAPVEEEVKELPKADEFAAGAVVGIADETAVKAPTKEVKEAKKAPKNPKKITMKLNQYFGYIWNGQAIDY